MSEIATVELSSKGQILIPKKIRTKLNLKTGTQFVIVSEKDYVLLKAISQPSLKDFDDLLLNNHKIAEDLGVQDSDIEDAITKVRNS